MLLNRPAATLVRAARKAKGLGEGRFGGFATRTAEQSRLNLSSLREMQGKARGPVADAIGRVADAFEAAIAHDPHGLVAVARYHQPGEWGAFLRTVREEMHHREAVRLSLGEAPERAAERIGALLELAPYRRAVAALVTRRPALQDQPVGQSLEVMASIGTGSHAEVGLSDAEAREIYEAWAGGLERAHGKERAATAVLRVHPKLRKELIDARYAGIRDSLRARAGDGAVRGRSDVAPGPQPAGDRGPLGPAEDDSPLESPRQRTGGIRSGVEAGPSREQGGLFDAAAERQSEVDAGRDADKLLGERLTAQFKSGLAAKPSKLKPAQNRGLFEEPQSESGNLFSGFFGDESGEQRPPEDWSTEDLRRLVTVGAHYLRHTGGEFGRWSRQMVEHFGEGIEPLLNHAYMAANRELGRDLSDPKQASALRQFLGDETGTSLVGAFFKADLEEMAAMKHKMDAAKAALEKVKADPAQKGLAEKLVDEYLANRNLWTTRVNQLVGRLRKLVPNHVDQEGLAIVPIAGFADAPQLPSPNPWY